MFTNAPLSASALQQALCEATAATYNGLSVDNTQSTNDMILLFRTAPSNRDERSPMWPIAPNILWFKGRCRMSLRI